MLIQRCAGKAGFLVVQLWTGAALCAGALLPLKALWAAASHCSAAASLGLRLLSSRSCDPHVRARAVYSCVSFFFFFFEVRHNQSVRRSRRQVSKQEKPTHCPDASSTFSICLQGPMAGM